MAPSQPTIEPWDSFGLELYTHWQGDPDGVEIIERDDGRVDVTSGPGFYFAPFEQWSPQQQAAKIPTLDRC